jgi:tetratricopeptide (TPR) repeat protein
MQRDPGSAEAWYLTGIALQSDKDSPGAINAYRNAVKRKSGYLEALNNLGHLLSESGRLQEAAGVFRELTSAHPGNAQAWSNLGVVCDSMGLVEEAETAYRKAITIDPARTDTLCHLGYMLGSEGRTREAIDNFDQAISLAPGLDTAIAGKASVLEKSGDIETAANMIRPLIDSGTDSADAVLSYSRIALRRNDPEPAIRALTGMLERDDLTDKAVSDLHRALGELFDLRQDFDTAFRHFELSNLHAPCTYKENAQTAFIDRVIKHSGADLLAGLPRAQHDFRNIAFIIGMPRSGTSLVEQIISSHPDVFGAGELRYMGDIACASQLLTGSQGEYPEAIANIDQAAIDTLARTYINAVKKIVPADAFITDKMPHNFRYLGLIALMFPEARIIHVRRNPLDNCLSLYFQSCNPLHSYSTDLHLLGGYYRQYERLMHHWRDVLDISIHDIQYEDIVEDLETSTARLLDICGLPWSNRCVEFHNSGRFVKTPSYDQVRRPIYTNSVERWRNYNEHLGPLREALGQ